MEVYICVTPQSTMATNENVHRTTPRGALKKCCARAPPFSDPPGKDIPRTLPGPSPDFPRSGGWTKMFSFNFVMYPVAVRTVRFFRTSDPTRSPKRTYCAEVWGRSFRSGQEKVFSGEGLAKVCSFGLQEGASTLSLCRCSRVRAVSQVVSRVPSNQSRLRFWSQRGRFHLSFEVCDCPLDCLLNLKTPWQNISFRVLRVAWSVAIWSHVF